MEKQIINNCVLLDGVNIEAFIPFGSNILYPKHVYPLILGMIHDEEYSIVKMENGKAVHYISRGQLTKAFNDAHYTRRIRENTEQFLFDQEILKEVDKDFYKFEVDFNKGFVKLPLETVLYFVGHMDSPLDFSVYCYIKQKWDLFYNKNNTDENYPYYCIKGEHGMLKAFGYGANSGSMYRNITASVERLVHRGLIKVSEPQSFKENGSFAGARTFIYQVNLFSDEQIAARQRLKNELDIYNEEDQLNEDEKQVLEETNQEIQNYHDTLIAFGEPYDSSLDDEDFEHLEEVRDVEEFLENMDDNDVLNMIGFKAMELKKPVRQWKF